MSSYSDKWTGEQKATAIANTLNDAYIDIAETFTNEDTAVISKEDAQLIRASLGPIHYEAWKALALTQNTLEEGSP
jgi:hypothetical protein